MKRSFHVTLIRPPAIAPADAINISSLTPPLALAYLSAVLVKEGVEVTNIDSIGEGIESVYRLERNPKMEAQGLNVAEIVTRVPEQTNLIGISCMFSLEWPATRDLILAIRRAFPDKIIAIGGEHASALPEFCLKDCPAVDIIVLGEGERVLLALVNQLEQGGSLKEIPGLVLRDGFARTLGTPAGKTYDGAAGTRIKDLDTLPWPAWDKTPLEVYLKKKLTFGRHTGLTMPILGSRGCPYECTFCSNPTMWGRRYITRSPQEVVKEILFYKERYGIQAIEFYDLTPIIKKSWILEFCDELIKQKANITWQISGGTRSEAIDEEVIIKAKASGCAYIGFAPESGVKSVLTRIKKRINLDHMTELLALARKHGVDTRCNIIIGFPEDTRVQILKSLLFQMRLAFLGVVDAPIFDFTPYPGSELFEKLRQENIIPELNDEYFESLGINFQLAHRKQYCKAVGPTELFFYRSLGMSVFYGLYYLMRPWKLCSFVKNIFSYDRSNSVFEQRLIQNFRKQYWKLTRP